VECERLASLSAEADTLPRSRCAPVGGAALHGVPSELKPFLRPRAHACCLARPQLEVQSVVEDVFSCMELLRLITEFLQLRDVVLSLRGVCASSLSAVPFRGAHGLPSGQVPLHLCCCPDRPIPDRPIPVPRPRHACRAPRTPALMQRACCTCACAPTPHSFTI